jgi:hypothetical protein
LEIQNALGEFEWLNAHPKYFERLRKDKREKDALAWFDLSTYKDDGEVVTKTFSVSLKRSLKATR